jgi:hypothetical protein
LIEKAGGMTSEGEKSVLDIPITETEQVSQVGPLLVLFWLYFSVHSYSSYPCIKFAIPHIAIIDLLWQMNTLFQVAFGSEKEVKRFEEWVGKKYI